MADKKEYSEDVKQKYARITDTFEKINFKGVTVLTGTNGSGKSLIRKQLPFLYRDTYGVELKDQKGFIKSTSMDARTSQRPEFGAMSSIMNDTSWIATSQNTYKAIKHLFKAVKNSNTKYLVVDEFEIGCGEETILALVNYINESIAMLRKESSLEGALIITHSRIGVNHLIADAFLNMEGLTKDEWLNREIVPTDLDYLDENELFLYIRDKS